MFFLVFFCVLGVLRRVSRFVERVRSFGGSRGIGRVRRFGFLASFRDWSRRYEAGGIGNFGCIGFVFSVVGEVMFFFRVK